MLDEALSDSNILFFNGDNGLMLAEILNVVQVFTPAQAVCYCCTVLFSGQQAETAKKPGKKTRYFGYYPHWTPEIVVGHWQAFLIVVPPA